MDVLLLCDNNLLFIFASSILIILFIFLYINYIVGFLLLLAFAGGCIIPKLYIVDQSFSNFLSIFNKSERKTTSNSCQFCGNEGCNGRDVNLFTKNNSTAHLSFTVQQSVDDALEELLNMILDEYIYSWYKEISIKDKLADDIRYLIRHVASSASYRLSKVDLSKFILNKVLPTVINHIDCYIEAKKVGKNIDEALVIQYMQHKGILHQAVRSRHDEVEFLRGIVNSIFPFVLPRNCQESKVGRILIGELFGQFLILEGMDLLADPSTLNFLFSELLNIDGSFITEDNTPQVLLLKNFSSVNTHPRNSVFRLQLSSVLKDLTLLYLFQNFLKKEGGINALQFCLSVEDFNRHILNPDLTLQQLIDLHLEAKHLYHTYISSSAVDRLHFSPDIVNEIKEIVHSEPKDIIRLRTTRPLFQAYEYAYNILEKEYMPLFLNSNAYFIHRCGERASPCLSYKSRGHRRTESNSSNISPFRNKYSKSQAETLSGLEQLKHRDLSAWRVSIPRVYTRLEPNGKRSFVFVVSVRRIDINQGTSEEAEWAVERRYHEFYILEAKLKEFHGELDEILPPKRSFASAKNIDLMRSIKQIFEEYLRRLLTKPALRGSQLLFLFLKSTDEFIPNDVLDLSFSRFIRDVPRKLVKERCQNLDLFISTFISKANNFANIPSLNKDINIELAVEARSGDFETLVSPLYGNNAEGLSHFPTQTSWPSVTKVEIKGLTQCLLFLCVKLCKLSMSLTRLFGCAQMVFGSTIDAVMENFLRTQLKMALCSPTIVKLINLIRDALFYTTSRPTDKDKERWKANFYSSLENLLSQFIQKYALQGKYALASRTLCDMLQHPILNKQLSYTLLEHALEELFPEIAAQRHH